MQMFMDSSISSLIGLQNLDVTQPRNTITYDLSDPVHQNENAMLEAGPNTDVVIKADEKRSTGYMWAIMENGCGARLTQGADNYVMEPNNGLMGGDSGKRSFTFQTLSADANYIRGMPCTVKLAYKRPWLSAPDSPTDIKEVVITVN